MTGAGKGGGGLSRDEIELRQAKSRLQRLVHWATVNSDRNRTGGITSTTAAEIAALKARIKELTEVTS